MKRIQIVFGILVLLTGSVFAQSPQEPQPAPFRHIVKWNPSSFVDFTPSVQFAYEFRPTATFGASLEAGWITNLFVDWQSADYQDMNGLRVRFEPRYYPYYRGKPGDLYVTPEVIFLRYKFNRTREFGFGCTDPWLGDCDYFRVATYPGQKTVVGLHAKVGAQSSLGRTERLWVDVYFGLGARFMKVSAERPEGGILVNQRGFFFRANDFNEGVFPSASAGFKVGYRIK